MTAYLYRLCQNASRLHGHLVDLFLSEVHVLDSVSDLKPIPVTPLRPH
jgi:hypothetical protein